MRDGASGRSRGFGFLTFRDPRTVNIVMVKEHYLDGKIVRPSISTSTKAPLKLSHPGSGSSRSHLTKIDPKRAIPRDEQERTSKIFVGGVSQDATEQDFKEYFMQYGRVVDATLMIDKDTGRPRGFGFVTFDNESAVDATLQGDLRILGKPIEVKKAQPRGNMRDEDDGGGRRGGRRGGKDGDRFRDSDRGNFDINDNGGGGNNQNQGQNQQGGQTMYNNGMTPQTMAAYWQRMQQYFATMQQQMAAVAAAQGGMMGGPMAMGGMNPAMMQQMQQMQQFKQMQALQQQMAASAAGQQPGSQSPHPQSPGAQGMQQGMNPAVIQQMQQLQQMQMQQQQAQGAGFGGASPMGGTAMGPGSGQGPVAAGPGGGNFGGRRGTPGYNAQEQLMFEQQKYEQQQARRAAQEAQQFQQYQQGGPTSWEGMYDDVPQPNMGGPVGGMGRGGIQQGGLNRQMSQGANGGGIKGPQGPNRGSQTPSQGPQPAPPANAPTGPKNAGKPGSNYRGGGRGVAHRGGFHPYARG